LYILYLEISHLKDPEGTKKNLTNQRREAIKNIIDKVDSMIDKFCYLIFGTLDKWCAWVDDMFTIKPKKKKKNSKRTYQKEKDHGTDITFENEIKK